LIELLAGRASDGRDEPSLARPANHGGIIMFSGRLAFSAVIAAIVFAAAAQPQQLPPNRRYAPPRPTVRLEPVAETKLVMEGMIDPNFRGLERRLLRKPADVDTWTIVRGQALLIAESGNLLMIRPPRNAGQEAWMARATDLRTAATRLARAAAGKDFEACRIGLGDIANACNRCHQTFRVPTRIVPFQVQPPERKVSLPRAGLAASGKP
jgi:hypothetical protein